MILEDHFQIQIFARPSRDYWLHCEEHELRRNSNFSRPKSRNFTHLFFLLNIMLKTVHHSTLHIYIFMENFIDSQSEFERQKNRLPICILIQLLKTLLSFNLLIHPMSYPDYFTFKDNLFPPLFEDSHK